MARNERTSKRVAKIAGRLLAIDPISSYALLFDRDGKPHWFQWSDIRVLAASCLTQTADKKPAKRKRRARRG